MTVDATNQPTTFTRVSEANIVRYSRTDIGLRPNEGSTKQAMSDAAAKPGQTSQLGAGRRTRLGVAGAGLAGRRARTQAFSRAQRFSSTVSTRNPGNPTSRVRNTAVPPSTAVWVLFGIASATVRSPLSELGSDAPVRAVRGLPGDDLDREHGTRAEPEPRFPHHAVREGEGDDVVAGQPIAEPQTEVAGLRIPLTQLSGARAVVLGTPRRVLCDRHLVAGRPAGVLEASEDVERLVDGDVDPGQRVLRRMLVAELPVDGARRAIPPGSPQRRGHELLLHVEEFVAAGRAVAVGARRLVGGCGRGDRSARRLPPPRARRRPRSSVSVAHPRTTTLESPVSREPGTRVLDQAASLSWRARRGSRPAGRRRRSRRPGASRRRTAHPRSPWCASGG